MKLSKQTQAHTKTLELNWCKRDYVKMSPIFRNIRGKSRNPMDVCAWCKHKFDDGEMMALACAKKGGNKTLCQKCADAIKD